MVDDGGAIGSASFCVNEHMDGCPAVSKAQLNNLVELAGSCSGYVYNIIT